MLLFLFTVVGGVMVGIAVWDYRRKAAQREAASQERFEQMFKLRAAATPAPPGTAPSAPAPAAVAPVPAAVPSGTACAPAERVLAAPDTLVYYLLRTALPDHEVFPRVTLAALVRPSRAGFAGEQQARRLAQHSVDFAVCDKRMRLVAVVELEGAGTAPPDEAARFKHDALKEAGVKVVTFRTGALPQRGLVRGLVCGEKVAAR